MSQLKWEPTPKGPVAFLGPYYPYRVRNESGHQEVNPKKNQFTTLILDLKVNNPKACHRIFTALNGEIGSGTAITVVPSSDPTKGPTGIRTVAEMLAASKNRTDATHCLVRHKPIAKLATGGNRNIAVHLSSIEVAEPMRIKNKVVWLLDDVMTSGNSLIACQKLLIDAGAAKVHMLALGKTTH